MSSPLDNNVCDQSPQVSAYAMQALPPNEAAAVEAHIASCSRCRQELEALRPVADAFVLWPSDVLRPSTSLQERLARRIAAGTGENAVVAPARGRQWDEPAWEEVAPGIFCKLMATDTKLHRVSMLVRLLPGVEYPPHTHAGLEELFLLDGELWIDDRKLQPGDYNRAEAGSGDKRVWSETGCTCVLITRYSRHSSILRCTRHGSASAFSRRSAIFCSGARPMRFSQHTGAYYDESAPHGSIAKLFKDIKKYMAGLGAAAGHRRREVFAGRRRHDRALRARRRGQG